jgi:hypothetical protein
VGTEQRWVDELRARYGADVAIESHSRTDDVIRHYARSAVVASVDADGAPVFLATKTGEALQAARRVLLIGPRDAPARASFGGGRWSSVADCDVVASGVAAMLQRLVTVPASVCAQELPGRRAALSPFREAAVASALLDVLCTVVGGFAAGTGAAHAGRERLPPRLAGES